MVDWLLDDSVLESYIEKFYGHGGYSAKYWFVGMEFGGGTSAAEIVSRIQGWHDRGGNELEDLSVVAGDSRWFRGRIPLQPTWAKLIRVVLNAEGSASDREQIRTYQREQLGRSDGLDCILELLPLPSPSISKWLFYPEYSNLHYLKHRETYTSQITPTRIAHLRERIVEYAPVAIIFYGTGYEHWWRKISGVDFKASKVNKASVANNGHTLFVTMPHPTAHGLTNNYFDAVGRLIADVTRG